MAWKDEIQIALSHLGGEAPLQEIYDYIENHSQVDLSPNWTATVRGTLERFSSDSKAYGGRNDLFYSVHGLGAGVWGLRDFVPTKETMDFTQDDSSFSEGRPMLKRHILRERNHQVISKAKERFFALHGRFYCEACGFDFKEKYGDLGENFIEGHHVKPVSQLQPNERTKVDDIILLCSNCHSMIHRKKPWLTRDRLHELFV